MTKLRHQLQTNDFTLLVSLPANNLELAQAALRGGARGLKVHVNVEHFASGTRFGSWSEESEAIAQIVALAKEHEASVGIVPGATSDGVHRFATEQEFSEMAEVGLDYFDAYPADAPAWTLEQRHLEVMMAAYHGGTLDEIQALEQLGMVLCEASIVAHENYGQLLNTRDLAHYHALCSGIKSPVIIPSQKKLVPRDMTALQATGARGVLIGAIVTGREAQTIEETTRAFTQQLAPEPERFDFAVID